MKREELQRKKECRGEGKGKRKNRRLDGGSDVRGRRREIDEDGGWPWAGTNAWSLRQQPNTIGSKSTSVFSSDTIALRKEYQQNINKDSLCYLFLFYFSCLSKIGLI